jgi:NAD(P)-dependent dehydrogenase (short-subunit alcohol dehydrogenase family)
MPDRLTNKVAVITGSSSGIGRAIALAFASEGAHIVCSDIREDFRPEYRTDEHEGTTVHVAEKLGAKAIYQKCDTSSSADVESLIKKAVETFGRVDIMVNNAGVSVESSEHGVRPVWDFEEEAYQKTLDINVKGVFLGTKYATKQMMDQEPHPSGDRGWVINMASIYGLGGGSGICKSLPFPSFYISSRSHMLQTYSTY